MSPRKSFVIAAALAAAVAVAGCTPATDLCPDGDAPGIGHTSYARIFNDAATSKVCLVQGSALKPGGNYYMNGGLVVVDGDVPAGARITVDNGKLLIDGNVAHSAQLSAAVPVNKKAYTTLVPIMIGKTPSMIPQTRYKFASYKHPDDTGSSLVIHGDVGARATLSSNHGIAVTGAIGNHVNVSHLLNAGYAVLHRSAAAAAIPAP